MKINKSNLVIGTIGLGGVIFTQIMPGQQTGLAFVSGFLMMAGFLNAVSPK